MYGPVAQSHVSSVTSHHATMFTHEMVTKLTTGFSHLSPSRSTLSHLLEVLHFFQRFKMLRTEVDSPILLVERIVIIYYCTIYYIKLYVYIYIQYIIDTLNNSSHQQFSFKA